MPEKRLIKAAPGCLRDATLTVLAEWRETAPWEPLIVVAPSAPVARMVVRDHAACSGGLSAGLLPLTLHDLARRMAAPQGRRSLPPLADRAMLADLLARDPGPLGARALRPSVVAAVGRVVRDLRLAGHRIDPDALAADMQRGEYESLAHVTRIERSFAAMLERECLMDDAAMYEGALGGPLPAGASRVVLHAVYDFESVQRELLSDISRRADVSLVFPTIDEGSSAERLLENNLDWALANGFAEHAFDPREKSSVRARVLACAGLRAEAREIAREVLAAAQSGRPFADMAVLLSRPVAQRQVFVEELGRAGVPVAGAPPAEAADTIAGRALLAAVRLLSDSTGDIDADAAAFVARLAGSESELELSSAHAESLCRQAGCRGAEPDEWEARLAGLARSLDRDADALDRAREPDEVEDERVSARPEDLREAAAKARGLGRIARRGLERVHAHRARHARRHAPEGWSALAGDLARLADELGLDGELGRTARMCAGQIAALADYRLTFRIDLALEIFQELFGATSVSQEDEPLHDGVESVDREGEWLSGAGRPRRRPGEGVLLIDLNRARGLRVPVAWCTGLSQEQFAVPTRPDPVLGDAVRWRIGELTGVPLRTSLRRAEEADLLFALAEAAGAEAVTLSWPRLDDASGRTQFPADPLARWIETVSDAPPPDGDPARADCVVSIPLDPPRLSRDSLRAPLDAHEYDVAAIAEDDPRVRAHLDRDARLGRGIATHLQRWVERNLTAHDGLTGADASCPAAYSPSSLQRLARCPFQFFLRDRLALKPGADDALAIEPRPSDVGRLAHAVLAKLFAPCEGLAPEELPPADALAERLPALVEEELARLLGDGVPGSPRIWRAHAMRLASELGHVAQREREILAASGLQIAGIETKLEGSLASGAVTVSLVGRSDRIDRAPDGTLVVTDYKYATSSGFPDEKREKNVFAGGRRLQLPVYARLLRGGSQPARVRFVFLRADTADFERSFALARSGEWVRKLEELVSRLVDTAREGAYFQVPEKGCAYCEYDALCGPGKTRLGELKQEDPLRLRHEELMERYP